MKGIKMNCINHRIGALFTCDAEAPVAKETGCLKYYGYCAKCWTKLTPERRAILEGREPNIEYRMVPIALSPWRKWGLRLYLVAVAVGMYLLWHRH
jgi:hypothetical protein